jgi:ribonucleoside-triphosphate reductase
MAFNAGTVEQNMYEALGKKKALHILEEECPEIVELYKEGYIHLNDLGQMYTRPHNCFNLDPRFIFENGFITNGNPKMNTISKPPKYLSSALNQLMEALINMSGEQSGGIGVAYFNWFIAPFWKKADEREKRQSIQNFIYRFNQLLRAGNQPIFSSLNLVLVCPDFLKEKYEQYTEESNEIIRYICEEMISGDARGASFRFPNLVFNITNANLDDYMEIFELAAKFGLPYFSKDPDGIPVQHMGCRTALPANFNSDPELDSMNCGNAVYSTISLPLIAVESKNIDEFKEKLKNIMDIAFKYTCIRRERIKHSLNQGLMPFYKQEGLYDIDKNSLVIGLLGLDDACQALFNKSIDENIDNAEDILKFANSIIQEYKDKTGFRWGLFSPPSENCCYTLAKKASEKHGFKESYANGNYQAPYFTNGINLNVQNKDLIKQLKTETKLSKYVMAGNINSIMLGEAYSDASGLKNLTEKIRDKTDSFFWAYSSAYSICNDCNSLLRGTHENCGICGGECEIFDRVTGYMTNTKTWNKGKQAEKKDRYYYND